MLGFGVRGTNASIPTTVAAPRHRLQLEYAAPELLRVGLDFYSGARIDSWSAGVVLFVMLTGVRMQRLTHTRSCFVCAPCDTAPAPPGVLPFPDLADGKLDKNLECIATGRWEDFWCCQERRMAEVGSAVRFPAGSDLRALLQGLLAWDAKDRWLPAACLEAAWMKGKTLGPEALKASGLLRRNRGYTPM